MSRPVSLLLVDDHALVRGTLADRLGRELGLTVVGTAGTADDAIVAATKLQPDIILMDIDMPGLLCFDAVGRIQQQHPNTQVIFLSAHFHDRYVEQALAVRAAGYVTKSEPPEVVIQAVHTVAAGGSYFSPEVRARIVIDASGTKLAYKSQSRATTLTPRELEVLRYLARGMSQKDIAQTIGRSAKTVHRHSINLMHKLDIHDRVELARFAIREGLAES